MEVFTMEVLVWPIVVVVLSIIFMLIFRQPISAFIARLRKVSLTGLEALSDQPQKVPVRDSSPEDTGELMKSFDSPTLREQEAAIQKGLEDRRVAGEEAVKVLTRHLAANQIALYYERLNSAIWGSQIYLLRFLNSSMTGETSEIPRRFYDSAAANYPDVYSQYSFESYMDYLVNAHLIIGQEGRYLITEWGRDFLVYLAREGISESRLY